jgi:hypothetical protein
VLGIVTENYCTAVRNISRRYLHWHVSYNWGQEMKTTCTKPAIIQLVAPDGKDVPGSRYCAEHAEEIICEYREKLGEIWMLRALTLPYPGKCGASI